MDDWLLTEPEKASIYGRFSRLKEKSKVPIGFHALGDMVAKAQEHYEAKMKELCGNCDTPLLNEVEQASKIEKIRDELDTLTKKLDDREADLIQAKKDERERITAIASFTVWLDGNSVMVDDSDWNNLWQALQGKQ